MSDIIDAMSFAVVAGMVTYAAWLVAALYDNRKSRR